MKLTNGLLAFGALLVSSQVNAAPITFKLEYSGILNSAVATVATGSITFEDTLLPNPSEFVSLTLPSPIVLGISLTVAGANFNGTFGLSDFDAVFWSTADAALDFSQELVGQDTPLGPWGTDSGTCIGEFNLISADGAAPTGFDCFTMFIGLDESFIRPEDLMWLTSMKVVPVPAAVWLFGSGLLGLIGVARSKRQS